MRILYHLTIEPPKRPSCEAISQEIAILRKHLTGEVIYLNPNQHVPFHIPRLLFGFHKLRVIRKLESRVALHHLYNPDPFPFPILRLLRKPVVYSLTGGMRGKRINKRFFNSLDAITVMDQASFHALQSQGLDNVHLVRPGIKVERFTHTPAPLNSEIRLLVGSAPWTLAQFKSKGIDALLEAAKDMPRLHLVFLWRGILTKEMRRRVRSMGLEDRVEILDEIVDVNEVLARVHASVTLATKSDIIKAYPHSLLESLAAGKPVLVSRAIPMADYVEKKKCGVVVEEVSSTNISKKILFLAKDYDNYHQATINAGRKEIATGKMIESFHQVYQTLGSSK